MEVLGLNAELIDVAVYTQQALEATARIARVLGEPEAAARYERRASELKATDQRAAFWIEEEGPTATSTEPGAGDTARRKGRSSRYGLKERAALTPQDRELDRLLRAAQQRSPRCPTAAGAGSPIKNWVISTPMEVGIAPRDRAIRLLDQIRHENVGAYGPYLSAVESRP